MDLHKKLTAVSLTDDLVVDILSRLTYKSFCRCKCAYKAWSAFSSDPDYREKLPKKVTTGLLYQGHNKSAIPLVSLCPDDGEIDGILADVPHYEHLEFLDCCNGLVLCKYRSSYTSTNVCRFVVCNPATREWRILPDTHPGTDDPRYVTILAFDPSWSPQFYIFNFHLKRVHGLILGTSKLEIFQSESSTWLEDDTLDRDINISGRTHLFVNGMLYVSVGYEVLVFEGLEAMSDGIPPYHQTISLPPEASYLSTFTNGCFGKSSGILHYALPHENGRSIVVWTLDDFGHHSWTWTKMCHLSMTDAFGKDEFVHYDDGGDGGEDKWFWNCDYRIADLDLERGFVFLHDQKANKLLSYNISAGKLNEIQDAFGWDLYYVYVPCYSGLPAQETSVQ
ncbi:hypothetical protein VPH35_012898 [Triticum aestivum]|uniref:F-box associated beta-propeller type 1 domain-containing protein n=1 Tax=Triticum aestivum TaxID=4565 RepID=A0A3B5ZNR5_WHEAT|nr:uncharacterized protein LOC123180159 [Triticum aestivum]XP_044448064.1 uncharacterized protein LOC123180159 [Triticum aestivum]